MAQGAPSNPGRFRRPAAAAALVACLVGLAIVTTGCLSFQVAYVPDKLLEGRGGNGWEKALNRSMGEPASESWGFKKTQTLVYVDRAEDGRGYPGTLTLVTIRTLSTFSPEDLKGLVKEQVTQKAKAGGLTVDAAPHEGTRRLASGAESTWFVYSARVSETGFFTEKNAEARIVGEVWTCEDAKTNIVAVGFAQVSATKKAAGFDLPGGTPASSKGADFTTWNELVGDPRGSIQGERSDRGILHHVAC